MGGFGSLLHAGRLAEKGLFGKHDAVLAFGPQAVMTTATLRPPASSLEELESLRHRKGVALTQLSDVKVCHGEH